MNRRVTSGVLDEIWRIAKYSYKFSHLTTKPNRWQDISLDQLYSLRMGAARSGDQQKTVNVSLEITRREVETARKNGDLKSFNRTLLALSSLIRSASPRRRRSPAAALIRELTKSISPPPLWVTRTIRNAPKSITGRDIQELTGLTQSDWNSFLVKVLTESENRRTPVIDRISDGEPRAVDLNVAARLSRIAQREETRTDRDLPTYDTSDRSVRIMNVTVNGFRGSAGRVTLDLTKNGKPVDVLLWGDNGVGKSTLVDGIEFTLQGKVDRSSDFNSSLRPSVRNLTIPEATAAVQLSDQTAVERSLVKNPAGRDEPSHQEVRPGFRIAPLVIRRADILRFLDTDALSRGTIFFDYFPAPEGTVGQRPDEELKTLEEERFLLRVARDDLAEQLSALLPGTDIDFKVSSNLESFVAKIHEQNGAGDPADPLSSLPDPAKALIAELRASQRRLAQIRKKLEQGVQTLNPIAYREQLGRIVPILTTVTQDLTKSFKHITRADHVAALKVLVAKSGPVSLDVVVQFDNESSALPQQIFSEGYKDLIALLFFLTVTKKASEFGQAKVLVLDDALQSVDSTIRLGLMDYVLDEFKDWQLIVTGHDRSWHSQLRGLFARRGRSVVDRSIARWSFTEGIHVSGGSRTPAETVRAMLIQNDPRMTAGATGILLEEISQELSWRIEASVTRREGDRYTLGDLWPGVSKVLRSTSLRDTVRAIDRGLDIRNLLGAHYNSWADSISWNDVKILATDSLAVYESTYCGACADWVKKTGKTFTCRCNNTTLD